MPARHKQIGQCAGHDQAMGVLCQSAVAHLNETKHPFDDPDRMLDLGPHLRSSGWAWKRTVAANAASISDCATPWPLTK